MSDLGELRDAMRRFTQERGWDRYHDPKSLALALVGEVGELAELLQWLPAEGQLDKLAEPELHKQLADELADVLLYLVRLADVTDVDLGHAALSKLAKNRRKHEVGTDFD